MSKRDTKCLVVPGTDFLRAYAGTHYLIEGLVASGVVVELLVRCEQAQVADYRRLPWKVRIYPYRKSQNAVARKLGGLRFKTVVLMRALAARNLLITESTHLRLAFLVKKIKPSLRLIQYCQELHLPEDYPHDKQALHYGRYATVPDLVIDVEPGRAQARREKTGLARMPLVLLNTVPQQSLPPQAPQGTLARLAGVSLPPGVPVLLHAGGIGSEKPLERVIDAVALAERDLFLLAFCNGADEEIKHLQDYAAGKLRSGWYCIHTGVPRHQLMPALGEADIGVIDYAYRVEPTLNQKYCAPTKLFEFMACGLALLGSANDSLYSIIVEHEIGACATDDSIEALAAALNKLLRYTANDLQSVKARARRVFAEKFSYEKCCSEPLRELVTFLKIEEGDTEGKGAAAVLRD